MNREKMMNIAGMFTGIVYSVIPFYGIYIYVKSFKSINNILRILIGLYLSATTFSTYLVIKTFVIGYQGSSMYEDSGSGTGDYYADLRSLADSIFTVAVVVVLIAIIILIAGSMFLKANDQISSEDRFNVTRTMGVTSQSIPLFIIYVWFELSGATHEYNKTAKRQLKNSAIYAVLVAALLRAIGIVVPGVLLFTVVPYILRIIAIFMLGDLYEVFSRAKKVETPEVSQQEKVYE